MFPRPKLTVCVPSRNRQRTFQETIRALLQRPRVDVQFVFADNSDDPTIMDTFMADRLADPRIVYLSSQPETLPMVLNWERSIEAAEGEFICMIGDDDYVDLKVIDMINRVQALDPALDVLGWHRMNYNWPGMPRPPANVAVSLETNVRKIPRELLYTEFFGWRGVPNTPRIPIGFYHGAVSKALMDSFKERFGSYCGNPVVDFDNVCKVVSSAKALYFCGRPFSVMGACAESNSAAAYNTDIYKQSHKRFMKEVGRNTDEDDYLKDTPFRAELGLMACILTVQIWFTKTYGYEMLPGWEKGFAEACSRNCEYMDTKESYDQTVRGYRRALRQWQGGKYIPFFKPEPFIDRYKARLKTGVIDGKLFLEERLPGISTPEELYAFVEQIIVPPEEVTIEAQPARVAKSA